MALRMALDNVSELGSVGWAAQVDPHELQLLGQPKASVGTRSVLLVEQASFDVEAGSLQFDASGALLLNLGTGTDALIVSAADSRTSKGPEAAARSAFGPGDREYLQLVQRQLVGPARQAAESVLSEVRSRWPGDLKKGQRLNFSNRPDNFWYVVVQPRARSLSITVRGAPDRFTSSTLELKQDRPGYTRFILKRPSEVDEAVRLIGESKRKDR